MTSACTVFHPRGWGYPSDQLSQGQCQSGKKTMTQKHAPLIDDDGEVRELTAADMRRMKPAAEVLDPKLS